MPSETNSVVRGQRSVIAPSSPAPTAAIASGLAEVHVGVTLVVKYRFRAKFQLLLKGSNAQLILIFRSITLWVLIVILQEL